MLQKVKNYCVKNIGVFSTRKTIKEGGKVFIKYNQNNAGIVLKQLEEAVKQIKSDRYKKHWNTRERQKEVGETFW